MKITGWSLKQHASISGEYSSRGSGKTGGQPRSATTYHQDVAGDRSCAQTLLGNGVLAYQLIGGESDIAEWF